MEDTTETWKDVKGFEGYFQVSNYGRVKSLERQVPCGKGVRKIKESIRTPVVDGLTGEYSIEFSCKNIKKHYRLASLVANLFLSKPKSKQVKLVHVNGNKADNRAANLEYRVIHYKLTPVDVTEIKKRRDNGESCVSIAEDYGVSLPTISKIHRGLRWKDLPTE